MQITERKILPFMLYNYKINTMQIRTKILGSIFLRQHAPVPLRSATFLLLMAVIALISLYPITAEAAFYKYVDSEGIVHFTNKPQKGTQYAYYKAESHEDGKHFYSYDELIYSKARKYGVPPWLVKAVVKAESNFKSRAVSRAGARGLMQLMPKTALLFGVHDVFDPEQNVDGGVRYLKRLIDKYDGKVLYALAAYNAGETVVNKYGGIPPYKETKNYIKKVLAYSKEYKQSGFGTR